MKSPVYIIVRFEVTEGELDTLVPVIQTFFREEVSRVPGFISSRIHRNEEGTVLINYATWESLDHFQRFRQEVAGKSDLSMKIREYNQKTDVVYEIPL